MPADIRNAGRILVITKFRYLGDTIVATPFLRQLHMAVPKSQITLLAGPQIPELLRGCPYLKDIWVVDPNERSTRKLISAMHSERFDACFLLNRSLHSAYSAFASRIPNRIGFNTEGRGPLLTARVPYSRIRPEIDCYLDLLRAVGLEAFYALPELWITTAEHAAAKRQLREAGIGQNTTIIAVQPGAKDSYKKQWAPSRFADVLSRLADAVPNPAFALIGAREEQPACHEVAALVRHPVANFAGRTGIREILAILANADILIANDTAMVHAAVALGTPTVTVHGSQTAAKWSYGPPCHRAVTASRPGELGDRHANRRALDAIGPEPVTEAVLDLLDAEARISSGARI